MSRTVAGVVRNGVVVLAPSTKLEDGTLVHVTVFDEPTDEDLTPDEREDLAASLEELERGELITGEELIKQLRENESRARRT